MRRTILGCLKSGIHFLESAGVPEAKISAEELLSHILEKPRVSLYLDSETQIEVECEEKFNVLLKKRANRYPLQYLLRQIPFRNVTLEIGEGCLIPRPETEVLIEVVFETLGPKRGQVSDLSPFEILDIGTGSGNIAISLAKECPNWFVTGTDISPCALHYAGNNAEKNGVASRVCFNKADLYDGEKKFDAIISNPPYLTHKELNQMQPELVFEPRLALDGGEDGLEFFRRISGAAKRLLKKGGHIFFEVGLGQARQVTAILERNGFHSLEISKDNSGVERIVSGTLGSAVIPRSSWGIQNFLRWNDIKFQMSQRLEV